MYIYIYIYICVCVHIYIRARSGYEGGSGHEGGGALIARATPLRALHKRRGAALTACLREGRASRERFTRAPREHRRRRAPRLRNTEIVSHRRCCCVGRILFFVGRLRLLCRTDAGERLAGRVREHRHRRAPRLRTENQKSSVTDAVIV